MIKIFLTLTTCVSVGTSTTTTYVVRHAEATYVNRPALTVLGFRQAIELKDRFENIAIDGMWSSDVPRAIATIEPLRKSRNASLYVDVNLRELPIDDTKVSMDDIVQNKPSSAVPTYWYENAKRSLLEIVCVDNRRTKIVVTHGLLIVLVLGDLCNVSFNKYVDSDGNFNYRLSNTQIVTVSCDEDDISCQGFFQ